MDIVKNSERKWEVDVGKNSNVKWEVDGDNCFLLFLGYAFLLFQDESSVQTLMEASVQEGDKTYFYVSSPTNKDKPVICFL